MKRAAGDGKAKERLKRVVSRMVGMMVMLVANCNEHTKDKKLKSSLFRLEEQYDEAQESSLRSRMLQVEDRGFIEPEGVEHTHEITQQEIMAEVNVATARKV